MFEKELAEKMNSIFGVKKVSYAQPSESLEQECLFLEITKSWNTIKDGKAISKVSGNASLFANADKLPFGFISKRIGKADPQHTKNLFFTDLESNAKTHNDLIQRSFSFIYFHYGQYDPELGTISSVEFNFEES